MFHLFSRYRFCTFAKSDIQKTDVIFAEDPFLKALNAPFVRCEVCYRLSHPQGYTCLECRYKTYCSLDCLEKDKPVHLEECIGYKQLTLIILDAGGIYRIFTSIVKYLRDHVFNQKMFRKKKTAEEIWHVLLKTINGIQLDKENYSLSIIKTLPLYGRLTDSQYSTLVATAFRLAVFIDTKTDFIETCFKKLTISSKQKLILVGSLLMRIHCNLILNTFDFEIGIELKSPEGHQADMEEAPKSIKKAITNDRIATANLNEHFKVNMKTDIWQRSLDIIQSTKDKSKYITPKVLPTKQHTQYCTQPNRILSSYKDNIAEVFFNPELIQTVLYGPNAGQPIKPALATALCAQLTEMTNAQRCYYLKRFARLFHIHYAEYFMQKCEVQIHQVLSLYSPKLRQFRHSCNPNVEIM